MSHYPLWAYRQQLEDKYSKELSNPYTDQQRPKEIRQAISEKVQDLSQKQHQSERSNIEQLKREM